MELNYDEAIAVLTEDSPNEEIDELKICFAEQVMAIEQIIEAEDDGEMDDEEADTAIAQVITESAQEHLDIFALEIEPIEMSAEDEGLITFSEGFADTLTNLIAEEYETPEDGVADLADATGLEPEVIIGMIEGEVVPDTATADAMASVFDSLQNSEAYKQWNDLTTRAYAEAIEEVKEEDDDSIEPALATMAAENNQLRAEFNAMQTQSALAEELRILERQANDAVSEGILTPYEKQLLLGSQDEKEDRTALFSSSCQEMGVPYQTQLDRIKFYLHVASQRGEVAMFSQLSTEGTVEEIDLAREDWDYANDYLRRNGF